MNKFESTLVGRTINSIPPGIIHHDKYLPDSRCIYKVHTMWVDEDGLPMLMAELIDDGGFTPPDQVKIHVVQLGTFWNLLPEEDSDEPEDS